MSGQPVHLFGVEHAVSLHEMDIALNVRALFVLLGAGDRTGIDHQRSGLALAHLPAKLLGLTVGKPQGAGITTLHRRHPKQHDIDAAIGDAVRAQRPGYPPGGVVGVPGFGPGTDSPFQIGDNPVGDAGIYVLPFGVGVEVCHDLLLEAGVAALRCTPARRRDRGVARSRAGGAEGDHPACTEPKAEEGRGDGPERARQRDPWTARGAAPHRRK